jgi:hypothetical protein
MKIDLLSLIVGYLMASIVVIAVRAVEEFGSYKTMKALSRDIANKKEDPSLPPEPPEERGIRKGGA